MHWTIWLFIPAYVVLWLPMGYGIWSKRRAGSVLLKLGRSSTDKMYLVFTGVLVGVLVLSLIGDLWDLFRAGTEMKEFSELLSSLPLEAFFLPVAAFMLFLALSRRVITEAGIFADGRLTKWERIESYDVGEKTLVVTWKRRWYEVPTGLSYPVPPLQKDAVTNLLAQHVSGATEQVEVV